MVSTRPRTRLPEWTAAETLAAQEIERELMEMQSELESVEPKIDYGKYREMKVVRYEVEDRERLVAKIRKKKETKE